MNAPDLPCSYMDVVVKEEQRSLCYLPPSSYISLPRSVSHSPRLFLYLPLCPSL